jgi:hypothetical protein
VTTEQHDVQTPAGPTILRLARIKQWFVPADAETYLVLKRIGVPLTQFHQDFLPTLQLLTRKHSIRAKEVNFKIEILEPFLDKVGATWNKKLHCEATIQARTMKFEVLKTEGFATAKASIPKLQDVLTKFFTRWGYRSTFEYSEARGKCKLNVEYWFDPERQPIVILEEETAERPKVRFRLGNLRLTFVFDSFDSKTRALPMRPGSNADSRPDLAYHIGYVHTLIEIRQGGSFTPLHSSKCKLSDLSSVQPLIAALIEVPNRNAHNFDVSAD